MSDTTGKNTGISQDLVAKTEIARATLLPTKSQDSYKNEYTKFHEWLKVNQPGSKNIDKTILLAYFQDISESYSPNSLWTKWSMIKAMLTIYNNVDVTKAYELEAFLKRKSKGYVPKKSQVLSRDNIVNFLKEAPNEVHLLNKVVLIMGYFGGCRNQELLNMKIGDIDDRDSVMVVNIPTSRTGIRRQYTIVEENKFSTLPLVRNYMSLRPPGIERFFLTYREKRCTVQPNGKNMFGKVPSKIASFLGLPNPNSYTGHCLRRSSATALANEGANMTTLKRHGPWRSSTVVESYLADSIEIKNKTARLLVGVQDESRVSETTATSVSSTVSSCNSIEKSGYNFSGHYTNCKFFFYNQEKPD